MNTEQIRTLDRAKTVVILPGGILEEHGPSLPSFTDGYFNEALTALLAQAIVARADWQVLIFPTIPLGVGGANEIGRKHVFPGTYAVRSATLRAVFMDLATELGEQGFRWIFVVHAHGAPNHNRMLEQAGAYFRDEFGGRMVHLMGLLPEGAARPKGLTEAQLKEDGLSVHAGAWETATMLFLQPDLVSPAFRGAAPQTGQNWDDLVRLGRAPDWPGYFGSPRLATAALGAAAFRHERATIDLALQILDGLDERTINRYTAMMSKSEPNTAIDRDALERERQVEKRQQAWLQKSRER
ncbi:MAG TPA: creatininase family protein [Gemmatimonadaceae bacterium]